MPYAIEIHRMNGDIDYFPEFDVGHDVGESVQKEYTFRFSSVEEGLWVELRHSTPIRPAEYDMDAENDPRGFPCDVMSDAFWQIVQPEDVDDVLKVVYNGKTVFARIGTHLANLHKLNALAELYLNDERTYGVMGAVSQLYAILVDQRRHSLLASSPALLSPEEEQREIALEMGVSPDILAAALAADAAAGQEPGADGAPRGGMAAPGLPEAGGDVEARNYAQSAGGADTVEAEDVGEDPQDGLSSRLLRSWKGRHGGPGAEEPPEGYPEDGEE